MGLSQPLRGGVHHFDSGPRNLITDVAGVRVGHCTVNECGVHSGVTAILPAPGMLFREKLPAAMHVINGFGKSIGLMQIAELGTLETPILLSNTLAMGTCFSALVRYSLDRNPEIGDTTGTVNPVALECCDMPISDIRALGITEAHAHAALEAADDVFEEGDVGAGNGMVCYDLKGGIGSCSRIIHFHEQQFTIGCLALANFGFLRDLTWDGDPVGVRLAKNREEKPDKGSVILVLATDAPLSDRQLTRICRRAQSGIARTGGFTGHGSGEIALAFTNAYRIPHFPEPGLLHFSILPETAMDAFFEATVSAVEESISSAMEHSQTRPARLGGTILSFQDARRSLS